MNIRIKPMIMALAVCLLFSGCRVGTSSVTTVANKNNKTDKSDSEQGPTCQ